MATSKSDKNETKTKAAPKTDAEKREAFKTKGAKATNRVLKALLGLRRIARPASYNWTAEQVDRILSVIAQDLKAVESAFRNPSKRSAEVGFTL